MQVGSYQVLFELARGGMGTVFLGRAVGSGGFERLVAIKRAHAHAASTGEMAERFLTEARIAAQVHHANVVSTHLAGSDEDGHFLVCDYVEGASLDELIMRAASKATRVPPAIVMRIGADALAGLHAAHETTDQSGAPLGILHRDVSVQNLLVGRDGVTRLADFGIAKSVTGGFVTDQKYVVGKLVYSAPEYLRRLPVGRTLDVYAMGISLFTALSGRHPWQDSEDAQLMEEILMRGAPPLASVMLELHPLMEQVVDRACRSDPCWRYQTAREMLDALEDAGRRTGCLAAHSEVAAYVESMVGADLAVRREAIRVRCLELAHTSKLEAIRDEAEITRDLDAASFQSWRRHWPRRVTLSLGLIATLIAILYAIFDRLDARATATPPKPARAASAPRPQTVARPSPHPEPGQPSAPAPSTEAAPVETRTNAPARVARVGATPHSRRPPRPQTVRRAPSPMPAAEHLRISTNNPYR